MTLAWLTLALVHTPPALAAFSPALRRRMYGIDEGGDLGLVLAHRGVLFLAIASLCVLAAFDAGARIAAALATSISLIGFLIAYVMAGWPRRLRTIALIDAIAAVPLALVLLEVWSA